MQKERGEDWRYGKGLMSRSMTTIPANWAMYSVCVVSVFVHTPGFMGPLAILYAPTQVIPVTAQLRPGSTVHHAAVYL